MNIKRIALLAVFLCIFHSNSYGYTEKDAIRATMGEARSGGYKGMLAISCAIRNRGTLKGVYGLSAKGLEKEPKYVWKLAKKAWKDSANNDITNNASYWGSKGIDKSWIEKMKKGKDTPIKNKKKETIKIREERYIETYSDNEHIFFKRVINIRRIK